MKQLVVLFTLTTAACGRWHHMTCTKTIEQWSADGSATLYCAGGSAGDPDALTCGSGYECETDRCRCL